MTMSLAAPWPHSRLSYRAELVLTVGAAGCGSLGAILAGARPTGSPVVDGILVVLALIALVLAVPAAPRWASVGFAVISAVLAFGLAAAVIGFAAVGAAWVGYRRHSDDTAVQSIAAALACNALLRSELGGFFGLSAIIGIGVSAAVLVVAICVQPQPVRRRILIAVGSCAGAAALSTIGAAVQARRSSAEIDAALESARAAVVAFEAGDAAQAAELIELATADLDQAHSLLDSWIARPGRALPVVAQHVRAGRQLSGTAADITRHATMVFSLASPDRLAVSDGRVDIDAVIALDAPLTALAEGLDTMGASLLRSDSAWLTSPVRTKMVELATELESQQPTIQSGLDGVRLAPQMLGAGGERRYLLLFTTPAELRGTGGFIGNYAELTVDRGQISIGEFARRSDLEDRALENGLHCRGCPSDLIDQYGRFGFATGLGAAPDGRIWSNLTMAAHFPDVAEAVRVLYPQSGGHQIDGVITLDPFVLQALMQYTGPARLVDPDVVVLPDSAARYILRDQYLTGDGAQDERIDGLDQLATQVTEALLDGALPDPATLVRDLGPLAAERRLQVWTFDSDEQAVLSAAGVSGAVPESDGVSIGMTINNAAANKIDVYLDREITTTTRSAADGSNEFVTDVTLTNRAPEAGLPAYVIGNEIDAAPGTSRSLVTFFVPDGQSSVEVNGESVLLEAGREAGWSTRRHFVELAAGETVRYRIVVPAVGSVQSVPGLAWLQPLSER